MWVGGRFGWGWAVPQIIPAPPSPRVSICIAGLRISISIASSQTSHWMSCLFTRPAIWNTSR